ncbi:MAG: c-type cytochrome domain-containing protein, partial [Planctomycetota bacterium]
MKWLLLAGIVHSISGSVAAQQAAHFETQIRPLLIQYCSGCHGDQVQKSGLRLNVRHTAFKGGDGGAVIVPGQSETSELIRRMISKGDDRMPPEGAPVPQDAVETLRRWIDSGAEWPESDVDRDALQDPRRNHWSFQPLQPVEVPDTAEIEQAFSLEARNE